MKAIGIIPARYSSTRFPGKPLINIKGKSMIQRVYEQSLLSSVVHTIYIATDDERIYKHAESFGANVVMTSSLHSSGTDRCSEAVELIPESDRFDIILNIQGDEPFLHPPQLDMLVECFNNSNKTQIATLIKKIQFNEELDDFNIVKAIINQQNEAIYFSRQAIPHQYNTKKQEWLSKSTYFKHIGIYAFKREILRKISKLKQSSLEIAEDLEQNRWIEYGFKIQTKTTIHENASINTPQDLEKIINNI